MAKKVSIAIDGPAAYSDACVIVGINSAARDTKGTVGITAAGIADADPWKTGWTAFSYAIVAFLVPFAFAYEPALLLQGPIMNTFTASVSLFAGCYGLAVAISGFHSKPLAMPWRVAVVAVAICCIIPGVITDIIGYAGLAAILFINRGGKKGGPAEPSPTAEA